MKGAWTDLFIGDVGFALHVLLSSTAWRALRRCSTPDELCATNIRERDHAGRDIPRRTQSVDPIAAIKALTHGAGADLTLDTSGTADGRLIAVRGTRPWGTACFIGEGGDVTIDVSPQMPRKQLTIIGSWTFSTSIQAECARFVADRKIAVDHLFTDRWKLEQADEAYRLFDRQTSGKGVFLMRWWPTPPSGALAMSTCPPLLARPGFTGV
jgi:hypothetical protein